MGGGGGRRLASHVLPGDLERGRGDLWQVNLAGHTRRWIWHVSMARHFGGSVWRVSLAHLFGGFSQEMKRHAVEQEKKEKSNGKYYSESVDCNVIIWPVI